MVTGCWEPSENAPQPRPQMQLWHGHVAVDLDIRPPINGVTVLGMRDMYWNGEGELLEILQDVLSCSCCTGIPRPGFGQDHL